MLVKSIILATALLLQTASQTGCSSSTNSATLADTATNNRISDAQIRNAEKAAQVYNSIDMTQNGELDNLKRYVETTTKPGYISYIVLMAQGRIINYYVAKGPVTDCNRELTPMQHPASVYGLGNSQHWMDYTADSPNDEGTYGGSNSKCIFFYTESGQLIRTSEDYVISDKPVRLNEQPLFYSTK